MAAPNGLPPMPKRQPQTKRLESYPASNGRSWGTWQGIAQATPRTLLWVLQNRRLLMVLEDGLSPLPERGRASQDSGHIGWSHTWLRRPGVLSTVPA
jgi:hypothetical protein